MDFKQLGIDEDIITLLKKQGITIPTEIQMEAILPIKEGKDVIGEAQTGTGKTLAFLLPIFENISTSVNSPQVLIISPTRELAIQITDEANKLASVKGLGVLAAYGGKDIGSQLKKLKKNIHVIIATPGRLLDHMNRESIDFSKLKSFVIDEADQMLLMGFKNEVEKIALKLPKKRQTLCFSATMDSDVKKLACRYTNNPLVISIKNNDITLENIRQFVVETTDRWKQDSLFKALDEDNPFMAIIFCRTKRRADVLEEAMHKRGYNYAKIHSDILQSKRERILKSFRNADIQYLIATDVASRGLDITGVTHIYNYDTPETSDTYIHRIGRTGRAGENGYTCLFVAPKDMRLLNEIESKIGFSIPRRNITL
ncbi:DEAD/DEAH box helicase [Clostridium cylindrosporum]|uniref:DEAD-box ATP-dependent RNA helicase CshA n=1 Tax=Clostridium cylindrosporum DSM 605 TaxID=1121307 RepID=A0A0J8D9J0_CLOCY|nr:DEAD/DEAH box helicase [Clostridium cylindrosporum]KMT20989.1 DEAD-box ATP-dependent RNA helicase CshA [Clostridium cylindrosporum DSM 605]